MASRLIVILIFSLFQIKLSYSAPRVVDPFAFALEQYLSDVTFEVVPYPNSPNTYPIGPSPINPYVVPDGACQCGKCPEYINPYNPFECEIPYIPCSSPCGKDTYPACSCFQDIREPCILYDDPGTPLYICFEGFDSIEPVPYLYFPQVEYPMSAMDIKPYYYGNCWCT